MHLGYYIPVYVVRALLALFSRLEVRGKENVPKTGALIIVSNHLNLMDPPLLAACFERRIVFVAKEELYTHPLFGFFVRNFGSIFVKRGHADRQALREARRILSQGLALGIFPEGTRSRTGELQKGYPGAAFLALHADAPILPVGITGTEKVKSPLSVIKRPKIVINIGKPFTLPAREETAGSKRLEELTDEIMDHIAEQLPESYRGPHSGHVGHDTTGVRKS